MKLYALAVVIFFIVEISLGDDKECKKQLNSVIECLNKKDKDNKDTDAVALKKLKENIDKCFSNNKCDKPDHNSTGHLDYLKAKGKSEADDTPEDVKNCIEKEENKNRLKHLNECLKKKKVDPVKDNFMDDTVFSLYFENGPGSNESDADDRKGIQSIIANKDALKLCKQKHGNSTANKVADCIKPVKEEAIKHICKRKADCEKESKLSDSCKKRFNDIRNAGCECAHDMLEESKKKVEALQANKEEFVSLEQLKNITPSATDPTDTLEKCYKETKRDPPAYLAILKHAPPPAGFPGIEPKLPKSQLEPIHESITDALEDLDCGFCK